MLGKAVVLMVAATSMGLVGCSAGNAIGSALGLAEILENDGSVQNPAVIQNSPANDDTNGVPDASAGTVPAELRSLFGVADFRHFFNSNPSTIFALLTQYGNNSVRVSDAGNFSLFTTGTLYTSENGEAFVNRGGMNLYCTFISSAAKYLCIAPFAAQTDGNQGASVNFLFDRLRNNLIEGKFEYCPETESSTECIDELINQPDGPVTVSVRPDTNASADASSGQDDTAHSFGLELKAMMEYLEQATIDYNLNNGIEFQSDLSAGDLVTARDSMLSD